MKKLIIAVSLVAVFGTSANTGMPCRTCYVQVDTSRVIVSTVEAVVFRKVDSVKRIIDSIGNERARINQEIDSIQKHRKITIRNEVIRFPDGYYLYRWHYRGDNFYKLKIRKL